MATNYDPRKKYSWQRDDKFEMSGEDFGVVLNALRSILTTEQAQQILAADRAGSVMEDMMAKYVDQGIIKEVTGKSD